MRTMYKQIDREIFCAKHFLDEEEPKPYLSAKIVHPHPTQTILCFTKKVIIYHNFASIIHLEYFNLQSLQHTVKALFSIAYFVK